MSFNLTLPSRCRLHLPTRFAVVIHSVPPSRADGQTGSPAQEVSVQQRLRQVHTGRLRQQDGEDAAE